MSLEEGQIEVLEKRILARLQEPLHAAVQEAVRSTITGASQKNHITRPAAGGRCAKVWDTLDEMASAGTQPQLKDIRKVARRRRWNANNARIEFYRWRHFNGIRRGAANHSKA